MSEETVRRLLQEMADIIGEEKGIKIIVSIERKK